MFRCIRMNLGYNGMKQKRNDLRYLTFITQFGIDMMVPILMCTMFGIYIGQKFDMMIIVIPLFIVGALAGFRSIYLTVQKISNQESNRDTKYVKKTK